MPRSPTVAELARQLADLLERVKRLESFDELAVATDKRLDKHMAASTAVHQDLRGRMRVIEDHIADILRRSP